MEKHHTDKEFGRKRRQTESDCCNPYETSSIFQLFQVENAEYRKLRDEDQELLIAQQNMETFLKAEKEEEQCLQKEKEH